MHMRCETNIMNRKCIKSFYLPEKQIQWLQSMAEINRRPQSFFVEVAIEKLIELTGGYPDVEGQ